MASNELTTLNSLDNKDLHIYNMIDNYIYLYHIDTFIVIPGYAESVSDSIAVNYSQNTPLSRSSPIYSYSNSGPRTVQVSFNLHRDMMTQINYGVSNAPIGASQGAITSPEAKLNDDYVDFMVKAIQAAALPSYAAAQKMVNPPMVAVRMGNDVFIKGVILGNVGLVYKAPILSNGKYSEIDVNITIAEVEPYDAETVVEQGSFRGLNKTLERRIYSATNSSVSTLAK